MHVLYSIQKALDVFAIPEWTWFKIEVLPGFRLILSFKLEFFFGCSNKYFRVLLLFCIALTKFYQDSVGKQFPSIVFRELHLCHRYRLFSIQPFCLFISSRSIYGVSYLHCSILHFTNNSSTNRIGNLLSWLDYFDLYLRKLYICIHCCKYSRLNILYKFLHLQQHESW